MRSPSLQPPPGDLEANDIWDGSTSTPEMEEFIVEVALKTACESSPQATASPNRRCELVCIYTRTQLQRLGTFVARKAAASHLGIKVANLMDLPKTNELLDSVRATPEKGVLMLAKCFVSTAEFMETKLYENIIEVSAEEISKESNLYPPVGVPRKTRPEHAQGRAQVSQTRHTPWQEDEEMDRRPTRDNSNSLAPKLKSTVKAIINRAFTAIQAKVNSYPPSNWRKGSTRSSSGDSDFRDDDEFSVGSRDLETAEPEFETCGNHPRPFSSLPRVRRKSSSWAAFPPNFLPSDPYGKTVPGISSVDQVEPYYSNKLSRAGLGFEPVGGRHFSPRFRRHRDLVGDSRQIQAYRDIYDHENRLMKITESQTKPCAQREVAGMRPVRVD